MHDDSDTSTHDATEWRSRCVRAESLEELIKHIDLHYVHAVKRGDQASQQEVRELLARCAAALSAPLADQLHAEAASRIRATGRAAEAFAEDPTDSLELAYFEAATRSYPFGPGEGCLALDSLGGHGTPGAGCTSGAGFLGHMTPPLDEAAILGLFRRDVAPWLAAAGSE